MADNFKGFDEETVRRVSNVGDAIKEIREQTRDLNKELKKAGGPLTDWEHSYYKISSLSRQILDTQGKSLLSSKGTGEALKAQIEAKNQVRALDVKINELLKQRERGNYELNTSIEQQASNLREAKDQAKILAEEYGKLANSAASLDKRTLIFSKLAEFTKDVKGLRVFASPFEAAAKASREQVLNNEKAILLQKKLAELRRPSTDRNEKRRIASEIREIGKGENIDKLISKKGSTFGAGMKAFTGEIGSAFSGFMKGGGPLLMGLNLLVKAIKFFIDAMFAADERVTKIAKGLAFSKDEARALYNNFKDSKHEINSIYNLTKDYTEAFTDLIDLSDFAVIANEKMVETQIILTKNLNLSKEEAFGVQEAFAASNIEADKGLEMVSEQVAAFSNQNKLLATNKKTLADIAKTSKIIQINFNGNLNSLVKTTLEAKKLGLTLDQVNKIGKSLLNFEQSISNELEAELLIGQDLNLERARAYALNHDIAGLTQEISKQGITQEKFAAMNVIQQEAIAGALGMSAEEMGDMLYKQKIIAKYGGDTLKNLKAQIAKAKELGHEQDAIALQKKYDAIEQGILDGKSALEAEKSSTAQEKFNQSLEQAKEIFSDFVDGGTLDALANQLKSLTDSLSEGIWGFLTGGAKERAQEKRVAKESTKYSDELSLEEKTKYESGLKEKIDNPYQVIGQYLANVVTQPMNTLTSSPTENITRVKDQLTKEYYEEYLKQIKEQNEYLKTQNQHLEKISNKEGTIMLNGTKMGTAMTVGSFKS